MTKWLGSGLLLIFFTGCEPQITQKEWEARSLCSQAITAIDGNIIDEAAGKSWVSEFGVKVQYITNRNYRCYVKGIRIVELSRDQVLITHEVPEKLRAK